MRQHRAQFHHLYVVCSVQKQFFRVSTNAFFVLHYLLVLTGSNILINITKQFLFFFFNFVMWFKLLYFLYHQLHLWVWLTKVKTKNKTNKRVESNCDYVKQSLVELHPVQIASSIRGFWHVTAKYLLKRTSFHI